MDLFNSWCEKIIDNYWVSWDEYNRISHIDRVIDCDLHQLINEHLNID